MSETTDNKFSFSTIEDFDNHINKSIPNYRDLISDVESLSQYFIEPGTNIVDIGCSTGVFIERLAQKFVSENVAEVDASKDHLRTRFIGIEKEKNLAGDFKEMMTSSNTWASSLNLHVCDVLDYLNNPSDVFQNMSLCTSIFTLQFLPRIGRRSVIEMIFKTLNTGGAFIFSEKIYATSSKIQDMMTFIYYDFKRKHFNSKEILEKETSLRKIMRPVTENKILSELQDVGFKQYDVFFRRYNFIGIIAIKD